jgi:hypothetical protein
MSHIDTWSVEIHLFGDDVDTGARALLRRSGVAPGPPLLGVAHAHARDDTVAAAPIGAEVAIAGALRDLSEQLLEAAAHGLAALEQAASARTR